MTHVALESLKLCFEGAVPAVIATASADGTPNITYLSRVHLVDHERVALSNQFFSKTARNLAENPRASLLLIDPVTYDQYRLAITYERTERGWIAYLNDLHKGRNTGLAWSLFLDVFALACVIFCVTGFVLLKLHAVGRPSTWPMVGLGIAVPVIVLIIFVH